MKARRKKPVRKAGKKSAKTSPDTARKAVAGNLPLIEPAAVPVPKSFFYGENEKFLWLQKAMQLEKAKPLWDELRKLPVKERQRLLKSESKEVGAYCELWQQVEMANTIRIGWVREEFSVDDLDKGRNEQGSICLGGDWNPDRKRVYGGLRVDEKKLALRIVKTTGSTKHATVRYAMAKHADDGRFLKKLGEAVTIKKKARPKIIDYGRISDVAHVLIDCWCGVGGYSTWFDLLMTDKFSGEFDSYDRHTKQWRKQTLKPFDRLNPFYFMPPLAFMSGNMRARFIADYLRMDRAWAEKNTRNIDKWASRLGLLEFSKPAIIRGWGPCHSIEGRRAPDGTLIEGKRMISLNVVT